MIPQHVLVGSISILLCGLLFAKEAWFLEHTAKGKTLVRWFGPSYGKWVFRGLIAIGITFGLLLAIGAIRPIQW